MKMISASMWCAVGLWVVLVLIMVPQGSWGRESSCASSSSCGKITNISHPFRLKDDPPNCGNSSYELECVNEVAVLRLWQEVEYHVEAINYNNYTIRLVDPNIQEDNCSSIPRYFLYRYNFSDHAIPYSINIVDDFYSVLDREPSSEVYVSVSLIEHVIYMSCDSIVSREEHNDDSISTRSSSCLDLHTYVVVGDYYSMRRRSWKPGCHVKLIALTSGLFQLRQQQQHNYWDPALPNNNLSYSDIHRALSYGFELSWLAATCGDYNCGTRGCYFNQPTQKVTCLPQRCSFYDFSLHRCGIRIVIRNLFHALKGIVHDFLYGMYTLIRFRGKDKIGTSLDHYITAVEGWYALLIYLPARVLFGLILLVVPLIYIWRRRHSSEYVNIENFLQDNNNLAPIRYSYKEIKKMTTNFKVKLGQGGYGSVYKGKLRSGPHVAIKMLKQSKANGQDFINEVATIGRIHHVNVVRLIGFCVEGSKRALVYDFMPNGSLDKHIFSKEGSIPLSYEKIYEISLGVARGISYLHHGCDMQILHFDIKPHNILLDENFVPKVSDFGLAKLYPVDHSIVTLTDKRGTIGYIAPELFYNNLGGISYKADVYSFGMLLMEVAGRRKNLNPRAENSSQLFFPTWIYDQFSKGKEVELNDGTEDERGIAKKMVLTALWCIQLKPCDRPSMKRVVEMLEEELEDLTMPPKPLLYPDEIPAVDESLNSEEVTSGHSTNTTSDISETTLSDNTIVEN